MRLCREVLEKQGVHGALETDVQLADFAFGQRDDRHTGETQMLKQRGDIRLIATDAIERFRYHDVELLALSILQERLDAWAQDHTRAGNSRILISADDRPLLALGLLPADAQLVFNRRIALIVGGIATRVIGGFPC